MFSYCTSALYFKLVSINNTCSLSLIMTVLYLNSSVKNTIGEELGIRTTSVLTRMDNVLGRSVGNSLEVIEAIEILKGDENAPKDVIDLTCTLGQTTHALTNHSLIRPFGLRSP